MSARASTHAKKTQNKEEKEAQNRRSNHDSITIKRCTGEGLRFRLFLNNNTNAPNLPTEEKEASYPIKQTLVSNEPTTPTSLRQEEEEGRTERKGKEKNEKNKKGEKELNPEEKREGKANSKSPLEQKQLSHTQKHIQQLNKRLNALLKEYKDMHFTVLEWRNRLAFVAPSFLAAFSPPCRASSEDNADFSRANASRLQHEQARPMIIADDHLGHQHRRDAKKVANLKTLQELDGWFVSFSRKLVGVKEELAAIGETLFSENTSSSPQTKIKTKLDQLRTEHQRVTTLLKRLEGAMDTRDANIKWTDGLVNGLVPSLADESFNRK